MYYCDFCAHFNNILKRGVVLGAVVMRELQYWAKHVSDGISSLRRVSRGQSAGLFLGHMRQEIETEGPVGAGAHVALPNERHAQDITVEVETLHRILHANHGLRESVLVIDHRGLVARNDLYPVAVGVQGKGQPCMSRPASQLSVVHCMAQYTDTFHAPLVRSLLESHPRRLQFGARGIYIASHDGDMPEAPTR